MRQFVTRVELRSTLFITTELNGGCLSTLNPGRFTKGMTPLHIAQETVWVPRTVWMGKENLASLQAVTGCYKD